MFRSSKVGSSSFHPVEEDPKEGGTNVKSGSPNVTQAQVNKMIENQPLPALSANKNVMNASGQIRKEPSDYQFEDGEAELKEPSSEDLAGPQGILREAIDPKQDDLNQKFGFPHSFFDHAFVSRDLRGKDSGNTVTVKGGGEIPLLDDGMQNETSVDRLLNMMPSRMTEDGHLERLSKEKDPAHLKQSDSEQSDSDSKVSSGKFFEAAAALKHAQEEGYDPATVHRHTANIDFRATNQEGKEVHFDPFESPRPKQPTNVQRQMQYTLEKLPEGDSKEKLSAKLPKSGPSGYQQTPAQWAKGTYKKHTDESKGEGVTGVWDQTSTPGAELGKLQGAVGNTPGNVKSVDLNLPYEYAREDNLARQQIEHRNQSAKDGTDTSKA